MTFLCTVDGQLVSKPHPWPEPWAFRCDGCVRILPYGCVITAGERRTSVQQARITYPDTHRCGACEGMVDQPSLWSFA